MYIEVRGSSVSGPSRWLEHCINLQGLAVKSSRTSRWRTSSRVRFPITAGILPSNMLWSKRSDSSESKRPKLPPSGCPCRLQPTSSSCFSSCSPGTGGSHNVPERPHRDSDSTRRERQLPIPRGRGPSSLLCERSSVSSEVKASTPEGIQPVN